jgi:hypothetical protein
MGAAATGGMLYALAFNLQGQFHHHTKIGIMLKHAAYPNFSKSLIQLLHQAGTQNFLSLKFLVLSLVLIL